MRLQRPAFGEAEGDRRGAPVPIHPHLHYVGVRLGFRRHEHRHDRGGCRHLDRPLQGRLPDLGADLHVGIEPAHADGVLGELRHFGFLAARKALGLLVLLLAARLGMTSGRLGERDREFECVDVTRHPRPVVGHCRPGLRGSQRIGAAQPHLLSLELVVAHL
jgi:hypothetical protein